MDIRYRVEINPSYEWSEGVKELGISHRELEVFALVTEGFKNKEIAEILSIKYQSVKNHLNSLYKKLNVRNDSQALLVALPNNLIKLRGSIGDRSAEVNPNNLLNDFRRIVNGEDVFEKTSDKKRRQIDIFFRSHGIDLDEYKKPEKEEKNEK